MKIAYVLNTYPQPSHSFIRRELAVIEADGAPVLRFAMRRPDVPLVDPLDQAEALRTEYVLAQGAIALGLALLRQAVSSPSRMLAAVRLAIKVGATSETGVLRHFIYLAEAAFVAERCARESVTHVHAHFGTNAACVAMLARQLGGPAYSFTVHGPEEFDAPRALSLRDKMHHAAFTVAVSAFGRSQLCRWADLADWDRLHVVRCGIDPAAFPDVPPLPQGALRLVSIGRFVEQKGQLILLQALAEAVQHHPDLHLALVGGGEMRPAIEAAIRDLNLGAHVTLTGWLDEAGVRAELAAAHALVMPSFAEGLPVVIMEAMAAGRPAIATAIAGIPELVENGETGWLVPAGDSAALARAIGDLAGTTPAKLRKMGKAGRARVMAQHDAGQEAARLAGLFKSV